VGLSEDAQSKGGVCKRELYGYHLGERPWCLTG
jgi:hypothetical protein